jgi:ABC-type cobalamin transport system ATPase subunit
MIEADIISGLKNGFPNFPSNFPTIDHWDDVTGFITSIKSMNLGSITYQTASKLESKLRRYLDDLAGYNQQTFGGVTIPPSNRNIGGRKLILAVPFLPSSVQQQVLDRLINEYAQKGVDLIVKVV